MGGIGASRQRRGGCRGLIRLAGLGYGTLSQRCANGVGPDAGCGALSGFYYGAPQLERSRPAEALSGHRRANLVDSLRADRGRGGPGGGGHALSAAWHARRRRNDACQRLRSEEHTSELQSLMRISYAVFCLQKKTKKNNPPK